MGYEQVWQADYDLQALNERLHDGATPDNLADRGRGYCNAMFTEFYPNAAPQPRNRVLEVGGGVGWIMQAVMERYPEIAELIDLDISENIIHRAQERWSHPRARYQLYDGLHFPFPADSFDVIYSCAALQHVVKEAAYFIFREMHRVLRPGGHAVIHLLSIHQLARTNLYSYEEECRLHLEGLGDHHWHFYYGLEELIALLVREIGVSDFDLTVAAGEMNQFVHFGKGGDQPFLRRNLDELMYPKSLCLLAELSAVKGTRAWRLAEIARRLIPSKLRYGA